MFIGLAFTCHFAWFDGQQFLVGSLNCWFDVPPSHEGPRALDMVCWIVVTRRRPRQATLLDLYAVCCILYSR